MVGGGGGLKVTLVFCFGPKPKFCSLDLDLDQAEQYALWPGGGQFPLVTTGAAKPLSEAHFITLGKESSLLICHRKSGLARSR